MSEARVLVSYSHDSEGHRQAVLRLTNRLRDTGVTAWIDQFNEHEPPESWPKWMRQKLDEAEFVVVVVTAGYLERFNGESPEGVGSGVRWEGTWITADMYHRRRDKAKFLPVVLRREDLRLIPTPLDLTTSYVIGEGEDTDFLKLVRVLHRSPAAVPAALGSWSSVPDSPGHVEGVSSPREIDEALDMARAGNIGAALQRLWRAYERLQGDQQAQAVYLLGVLCHQRGDVRQAYDYFRWVLENAQNPDLRTSAWGMAEIASSEWNSHCGEHGPVAAAQSWLNLLRRKWKASAAWKLLDDNLRLALAQDWIIANAEHPMIYGQDPDELAKNLAWPGSSHQLAKELRDSRLGELRSHYAEWNQDTWTVVGTPRRIGLDYEIVVLAPTGEQPSQEFPLLLRRVGREWRIANFQPAYVIPGRPPRHEEIPGALSNWGR